ncbi:MAG: N-acetylmuramoyl-L-alanine amidase [Clostridia bacterium]|nr:N-acetylmuramoyl-L-alanine amidase [Clostridia bacterium]
MKSKSILIISVLAALAVVFNTFSVLAASPAAKQAETVAGNDVSEEKGLCITSPAAEESTVTKPYFTFKGTCDPNEPLKVNKKIITPKADGSFSYKADLKKGKNKFTFSHKGNSLTYTVTYQYVLIKSVSPAKNKTYAAGAVFPVSAVARNGSTVKARFRNKTILLTADKSTKKGDFITYKGKFAMPTGGSKDINAGKITFTATLGEETKTLTSGTITCKKTGKIKETNSAVTPSGGKYMNVGSGYVAEIVSHSAETFTGTVTSKKSIDWSRPTNNYLPAGTMDYCLTSLISYKGKQNIKKYVTLRAGYRVYQDKLNTPNPKVKVTKMYAGTLPDHNEISVLSYKQQDSHMVLKLGCLWKAPFYFKSAPQDYIDTKTQDYRVTSLTCNHIDITFCYATKFYNFENGKMPFTIDKDDPIFKSVKLIKNKSDCTLRLYLKKQGGFYGWDSYYNKNGDLCFDFLIPRTVKKAKNSYGVDLNGAVILLDVGHGGKDIGAPGRSPKKHNEATQNLLLANKIKKELTKIGANVVMTRTNNVTRSSDQKLKILRSVKPDYCLAIHHDSSTNSSANGFCAFYFQPISKSAAAFVRNETAKTKKTIYKKVEKLKWHTYYMLRCSACPVVLTENGFISSPYDYKNIVSGKQNTLKAQAITKGIVDYFKSIQ